uniref:PH domain-containing protein n=1 Tax=candidate division CPR3 bacterium TaxID=2268181 RepID=A0A7C4M2U5_UNCC3
MIKKYFSTQNDDEKIIKISNRHFFTFFRDAIGSIFIFFASLAMMLMFFYVPYVLIASFIFFVFSIIGGFYSYFTWERDKYIITDQRIIDIDQITLFTKSQKEATFDRIQDVTSEIRGFWGSVFNYGNVIIQTAGENSLTLNDIANPEQIQKIIFDLAQDKKEEKDSEEKNVIKKMASIIKAALSQNQNQKEESGDDNIDNK